ncbi:MAG: ribonuclease Z [Spirochaetales bacterium]|nr:ribonuclease Z [Spirochaetales bacterium]
MDIYVLGCGGMMPLPGRHLTSVIVRRDGELQLFDCGEATQISLKKLDLRWKKISTIYISHTHADHITGLPGMLMLSAQVDRTEPLTIIGPKKIKEYIETSISVLDMYINYEIIIKEIENPEEVQIVNETDEYFVKSFPLDHSKVCVGYTLIEKDRPGVFFPDKAKEIGVPVGPMWSKLQSGEDVVLEDGRIIKPVDVMGPSRKGRKFSYVTDTAYIPTISPNVENSDLLICESMFEAALIESAKEKKHLTSKQTAKIAKDGNVKQLGLIHYSPRYMEKELKKILEEAKSVFPNTVLTRDRMIFNLPYEE